jgi:hypothetical protein
MMNEKRGESRWGKKALSKSAEIEKKKLLMRIFKI